MIESNLDTSSRCGYIVACPNMSANWRTTKIILWFISFVTLLIAVAFSFFGLWLILPFAGLEVLALFAFSYWVAYQCCRKEVITIKDNQLKVEKGYHSPQFTWRAELFWTRLIIDRSEFRGHPLKLYLRSKKQQLEIGEFLNEDDKEQLISALRGIVIIIN